jgi:lipopolysaccharide export system protein LptA
LDNGDMKFNPAARFYLLMQCAISILLMSANYAAAQNKPVYRCPPVDKITHFTDNKAEADSKGCSLMTGGNVTVVQGTRVAPAEPVRVASVTPRPIAAHEMTALSKKHVILIRVVFWSLS